MHIATPLVVGSALVFSVLGSVPAPAQATVPLPMAVVAHPGWAKSLGAGVVVFAPAPASPGHGSPAGPVAGEVSALNGGKPAATCPYLQPSFQSQCRKILSQMGKADIPTVKNFAMGYIAVDGKQALVGSTGIFCVPGEKPLCVPNHNPAAILSSGKSFKALWAQTNASSNSAANLYELAPCQEIGGSWYVYISASVGPSS